MLQRLEQDIKTIIVNLYQVDKCIVEKITLEESPEKIKNDFDYSTIMH